MAQLTMLEAITAALREELARDPTVVLLGEDIGRKGGVFGVTRGLQAAFGELRVLDAPVAEVGIAGIAIGAALAGLRPVAEFEFADYLHPAFDQIVNEAATIRYRSHGGFNCPVVFRAPCGGGVHGGPYHSQSVEAYYAHVPGIKVVVPATPGDAKGLLKSAIRDDDPVVFLEHKGLYRRARDEVPDGDGLVPLGQARLDRPGSTLSVLTYGMGVHWAREAAAAVAPEAIDAEIVDLRTVHPLDREAIATSVARTNRALIVHEANRTLGVGAELAAFLAEELFDSLAAPVLRVAAADCHVPFAASLEQALLPNAADVANAMRRLAAY